ncbi:acetyl-CoA carboxylase carboxyltransferase subunit alpha/beta [Spiractinospora alimapuensis]|uniref:carboxyl transferase domain-containing protein n=1 Tax=Spiractinospora alimapuensis TaxID=2820884 RepID=UPI001F2BB10F|nr:carboxyl transferase domain-containing protein [Spiractinospora alimapuensis]QVQ54226.1 acetyl-CoA carboxylase carboxyltransferase subunit alpha/beta [Spiractinospora alimapuensis]
MASRISARQLLERTLDAGSFVSWDSTPLDVNPSPEYAAELAAARERSGADEAVITGEGLIRGRRVAVVACEFSFLAGSIGVAAAQRLVEAVERATAEGLALLAAPASGGTRMQEGTVAFLSMVKISAAIAAHKAAQLPYLVYLRNPTTGGVLASWGSQGHVTVAEPGALIGFLGPRVYEALYEREFPEGVQTAENLYRRGLIDAVLEPEDVPELADRALNVLMASTDGLEPGPERRQEPVTDVPAWDSILRSRREDRPGVRQLLRHAARDVIPLNGTGDGERDPGLLFALAKFGEAPCVLLGQDRARQTPERPLGPAALREARRGMRMAQELGIPLVTVIDTPGAALSKEAEERGMAASIARCLAELVMLPAPTVSVLLGQGTGGGALALIPADRVLAAQHAWLSPLPPEGASAIVYRTVDRGPELAEKQGVRSLDLLRSGIVDRIVPEHDDAAEEVISFCERVGEHLRHELVDLLRTDPTDRRDQRLLRYRRLGVEPDARPDTPVVPNE